MGNVIIKSLQFLVRLLEWEQGRLSKKADALIARCEGIDAVTDQCITAHYEKADRAVRRARAQRQEAEQRLLAARDKGVTKLRDRSAKATSKAQLDRKVVAALRPIVE